MKVNFFKRKESVSPDERPRDIYYYLDRIKEGKLKKEITDLRAELDPEKKKALKGALSGVTFCGTFTVRKKDALKQGSGFAILDFDKLENLSEFKKELCQNKLIHSCWISPSGNGLKALVKIPVIQNDAEYKNIYKQLKNKFPNLDESGSDISRLCFESYDPDLYLNLDSLKFEPELILNDTDLISLGTITNVPLIDNDEIANRLIKWFKDKYDKNARNSSLFKLAIAFNDFGVSKDITQRYCHSFAQKDFNVNEIDNLINSAYKNTSNFGSKHFEDKTKIKKISSFVQMGKDNKEIINQFPELIPEKLEDEINLIRQKININEFWYYTEDGTVKLSPHKFKFYLENKNFFKHYPLDKSKTFTFIIKEENFVDEVSEFQIKDFVLNELLNKSNFDVFDLVSINPQTFNNKFLSMLETAKFSIEQDTEDYAMLYFRNCALRVWKDKVEEIPYKDLNGFVWKKQVIERDYIKTDHHDSCYRKFLWLCSGQDVSKYNSLRSVAGYLLHSYKTSANNKAIIFNDETISENPNGGSGKSIFWNALSHLKKVSDLNGKNFEFTKSFPYQSVPTDTQILVFDDVKKNFNFENLFSTITEGITLEYKGQDAIKIPVQKSPKIVITTNYTIKGVGGSFERRKFEVEMSSYFNKNHTPEMEFGFRLFENWPEKEWSLFDNYMINCLQSYLKKGLIPFNFKNLENRKLINETAFEFIEFMDDHNFEKNVRHSKIQAFDDFTNEHKDFKQWLKQKKFTQWIQRYCEHNKFDFSEGNSNGVRWFMIGEVKKVQEEKNIFDDVPF